MSERDAPMSPSDARAAVASVEAMRRAGARRARSPLWYALAIAGYCFGVFLTPLVPGIAPRLAYVGALAAIFVAANVLAFRGDARPRTWSPGVVGAVVWVAAVLGTVQVMMFVPIWTAEALGRVGSRLAGAGAGALVIFAGYLAMDAARVRALARRDPTP